MWAPKFGELTWVGEEEDKPTAWEDWSRTKLFVCRGCVAPTVYLVVTRSKEEWRRMPNGVMGNTTWTAKDEGWRLELEEALEWVKKEKEEWEERVPEMYRALVGLEDIQGKEVMALLGGKGVSKEELWHWLDQKAWDHAQEDEGEELGRDVAAMVLEEVVEAAPWEEVEERKSVALDAAWEAVRRNLAKSGTYWSAEESRACASAENVARLEGNPFWALRSLMDDE